MRLAQPAFEPLGHISGLPESIRLQQLRDAKQKVDFVKDKVIQNRGAVKKTIKGFSTGYYNYVKGGNDGFAEGVKRNFP